MGLFTSTEFNSFEDLFLDQLQDIYDAEQRITQALPKMAEAAHSAELKQAFENHLAETERQVARLESVFEMIGQTAKAKTCDAMKGLISEGEEIVQATGDPAVCDAALIAAAQRVEHYEISAYGTARAFALRLGRADAAELLQDTLEEEKAADRTLTEIAERSVNVQAERA
jgi:ferritin-like metal-binding protein YciE